MLKLSTQNKSICVLDIQLPVYLFFSVGMSGHSYRSSCSLHLSGVTGSISFVRQKKCNGQSEECHFKIKFLWRYGRELCYTYELILTLYSQNEKENCVDFHNSVFPEEAKMCFGFMSFRARAAAVNKKNYHNSPNMQPIITEFQMLF